MEVHKPNIITDGGPWAEHDYQCPVCREDKKAVLQLWNGIFQPCWDCQKQGWKTIKIPFLLRWLFKN